MSQPIPAARPDPDTAPASAASNGPAGLREGDLAAYIAGKLCHDFISPSGAIVSGLDLLKDPSAQDMREDAMALIEASAGKLVALVHFARVAFGAATTAERFDPAQLRGLAEGVFASIRAELDWDVQVEALGKPQARALLNLAQVAGGSLAHGGVATVRVRGSGGALSMTATAAGPRARLKPEAATGLRGELLTDGLAGQWVQPYWLARTVSDCGGSLEVETAEDRIDIRVRMPA